MSEFVPENKIHGPLKKMLYLGFSPPMWVEIEIFDEIDARSEHYPNQKSMECDSQEMYQSHLEQYRQNDEFPIKHQTSNIKHQTSRNKGI
jgi:hypothetical protein